MKFYDITKCKPHNGQWCFIRELDASGKRVLLLPVMQCWYDGEGFTGHARVVSWAPIPPHINVDPRGWLSPYRGDDLPDKDAECLVCIENRKTPFYAYFHLELDKFLGVPSGDVLAYQYMEPRP